MFERCLYFNSNALARKLSRHWEAAFDAFDLAPSHGYLVRLVLEKPGLTQQNLADEMLLERSTIARFLDRLEEKGLVVRQVSVDDPRIKTVFPTPAALKLQEELRVLGDQLYKSMCKKFGTARVAGIVKDMREISDAF